MNISFPFLHFTLHNIAQYVKIFFLMFLNQLIHCVLNLTGTSIGIIDSLLGIAHIGPADVSSILLIAQYWPSLNIDSIFLYH